MEPSEILWSPKEIEMINMEEIFQQKPSIIKKAETYLNQLKEEIINEISRSEKSFPPGTDVTKGQLVRGENHKGFPFLSMDMPQRFSKSEMFTYRTLFWWGHYLGFSFILKGSSLAKYLNLLLKRKQGLENLYFSCHKSPWEWELKNFNSLIKTPNEEIRKTIDTIQYLKIFRFFPVYEPSFKTLNWPATGLKIYKDMTDAFLY